MADRWTPTDTAFMEQALALARTQLGKTGINPAVGCVIVEQGVIVGQGVTADGGRPHGEAMALAQARLSAKGATVYVTLEPCAHQSSRGSDCTGALIEADITRLFCCLADPDPRTTGLGFARLREAGILVYVGLLEVQGQIQIADFAAKF